MQVKALSEREALMKRMVAFAGLALMLSAGCNLQKMTGDMMAEFAVEHTFPYTMSSSDVDQGCEAGVSMGGFLGSYSRVETDTSRASIVSSLSAAMCAEAEAFEAELRRLRALHEGRTGEALDALILEKQKHRLAAERNYAAYLNVVKAYGEPGKKCPKLDSEDYPDDLLYLLGLSSGMLAMVHDRHAGGAAGIPMDLPPKIARAAKCVNNDAWWGMPAAMKAAIEIAIPGAGEGGDPWAVLKESATLGDSKGMSMARALLVQTAGATGEHDMMCAAAAKHGELLASGEARNSKFALLDAYGAVLLRHELNKDWTKQKGHRAPVDAWTCVEIEEEDEGGDDLLDDMLGSDPPPKAPVEDSPPEARPEGEPEASESGATTP